MNFKALSTKLKSVVSILLLITFKLCFFAVSNLYSKFMLLNSMPNPQKVINSINTNEKLLKTDKIVFRIIF